jgi:tetratricopeptide (TPR) repeat protein
MRAFKRDHAGALKDLDAAIANGLKSERVYTDRASVKYDMGDVAGAVADYQAALAVNPDFASAHNGLASLLDRNGDLDGAIIHLQRFLDRYEGAREGKLPTVKGETSAGIGVSIKRDSKEKDGTQVFMESGEFTTTFKANSPEEMERQQARYEQLMNLAFVYANLGKMYAKKNDLDKALENYDKGLRIRKNDSYILNMRGEARIKKGDLQGAIEDLSASTSGGRGMADRHLHRGLLLVLQGKDAEAEKEFALHRQTFPGVSATHMDKRIEEARQLRSRQTQQ